MDLNIQKIENKEIWENFLKGCEEKTFLQSWNWGEFQKMMGNKVWRRGIYENGELMAVSFFYKIDAKRGTFLFLPHGPMTKSKVKSQKSKVLEELIHYLKNLAESEKVDFIRIAPIWERTEENIEIFRELGFRETPIHMHPELTWQLDITPSEEDLLMQMRKTTRYLIRQGLKNKDIKIHQSKDPQDMEIFNKLYQETVKRHHFVPFSLNYLKNEFLAFLPDDQISIFLGQYKNEVLASAVILFWQGIGFYHQGASFPSKVPVNYLLQWEAIKEAKRRGCKIYNFWGIANEKSKVKSQKSKVNKEHPWWGLTLFKTGFGGHKKAYVKTQDFIISKKYWFNFCIEKIRKIKRGF